MGQVVGRQGDFAFITGPDGRGVIDLGVRGYINTAEDINNSGQIAGTVSDLDGSYAFIISSDATNFRVLDSLGGRVHIAQAINNSGQIAGWDSVDVPCDYGECPWINRAFITGPNGMGIRDLGTLGGNSGIAYGINEAGQAVGWAATSAGAQHAFITGPNGEGMRDLGTLVIRNVEPSLDHSIAHDINDSGLVVGQSNVTEGTTYAFITGPNGEGMIDLGTLGGTSSSASGINDAGQAVGWSNVASGSGHAFIIGPDGTGMSDLNSLLDLPQGVILTSAIDINNNGQVIAAGVIPQPETYALMLAGLSMIGLMARRKKAENVRRIGALTA